MYKEIKNLKSEIENLKKTIIETISPYFEPIINLISKFLVKWSAIKEYMKLLLF